MERLLAMGSDAAVAAVVLLPLFLFYDRRYWHDARRTAMYLLFALYLSGVYAAAGLPEAYSLTFRPRMNTTFFAYMFSDYRSSLLNVLFFVPLGFLLPIIWGRFRAAHRTVFFAFLFSLTIELSQLFTPRATDVNDLMTNTAGAFLGWAFARFFQWMFPGMAAENPSTDLYKICGGVAVVMFFLHPLLRWVIF